MDRLSDSLAGLTARLRASAARAGLLPSGDTAAPGEHGSAAAGTAPELPPVEGEGLAEAGPPAPAWDAPWPDDDDDDGPEVLPVSGLGLMAAAPRYLLGRAVQGRPIGPVEAADLAEVLAEGCCRTPHLARAEALGLSLRTVQRERQSYGRRLVGDPDAPWLSYRPGYTGPGGRAPSLVVLVEAGDARQIRIPVVPVQAYPQPPVDNSGSAREDLSLGVTPGVTPSPTRLVSLENGLSSPAGSGSWDLPGPLPGQRDAGGAGRPGEGPTRAPADGPPWEGCTLEDARPGSLSEGAGRVPGAGDGEAAPSAVGPSPAGARPAPGDGEDLGEGAVPAEVEATPEAMRALQREALAQALRLLSEARAAGVLRVQGAYAAPSAVARALLHLRAEWGGLDPAIRGIRAEVLHLLRQREAHGGPPQGGLPGRAVLFFTRPARCKARWWSQGAAEGWGAPGWVQPPRWDEVPGWAPAGRVERLPLGPEDPSARVLLRRQRRGDRAAAQLADDLDLYTARLSPEWCQGPGSKAAEALCGPEPHPMIAEVLADHGPDFLGTLRRWQRAAAGGSERCTELLRRLDAMAPARRPGDVVMPPDLRAAWEGGR